jgi:hypothetical protein
MAGIDTKRRRNRIIGGAILAAIIVIIILMVVPILGGDQTGMISSGGATEGANFGIHYGAYQ